MTPKKKAQIWGIICLIGFLFISIEFLILSVTGIFTGLVIIGMLIIAVGLRFLIHYIYKTKTGKDTPGMRFWKWVLRIKE